MRRMVGVLAAAMFLTVGVGVLEAQDMVGEAVTDPPASVGIGVATITGTYQNLGPGSADNANVSYIFGINQTMWSDDGYNALMASTLGTDTMGNEAWGGVLWDWECQHFQLVLAEPDPTFLPMYAIPAGGGGTFTWELPVAPTVEQPMIPMAGVEMGRLVITEPEALRNTYSATFPPADPPLHGIWSHAGLYNLVSQGWGCNDGGANCEHLEYCFGQRLWEAAAFEAEVMIALDGSADHYGCDPWTNSAEIAGKIALIRRGDCTFYEKADNAQVANAAGMIIVNHPSSTGAICAGEPTADPQECVIGMAGNDPGDGIFIDLPFVMMSMRQGEELFTALDGGQTVRAAMGAIPGDTVDVFTLADDLYDLDQSNILQVDRVPLNYIFTDGFETGDCSVWSAEVP
jgi:hypothetical protein